MTLQFNSLHQHDMETQVARWLTECGWFTQKPDIGQRERPCQLARRIGMSHRHVIESLKDPCCPPFFKAKVGPTGRLCELVSNPKLETWLTMNKRPACAGKEE